MPPPNKGGSRNDRPAAPALPLLAKQGKPGRAAEPKQYLTQPISHPTNISDVIPCEIPISIARQRRGRADADDRTAEDVERDHVARPGRREQRRRDQRRRPAREYRRELKADRSPAVTQARGEHFGGQRRQRPPHQVVEKERDQARQDDQPWYTRVEQGVIGEGEEPGGGGAKNMALLYLTNPTHHLRAGCVS
jgi:hypothetical protein